MFVRLASLSYALLCCSSPALQSAETVPPVSGADPFCACVAQGKRWAQGEEACISGLRMVCGMNQNVTTWQSTGQSCQISSLSRAKQQFTPM